LALHFGNGSNALRNCHGSSRSFRLEDSPGLSYKVVVLIVKSLEVVLFLRIPDLRRADGAVKGE